MTDSSILNMTASVDSPFFGGDAWALENVSPAIRLLPLQILPLPIRLQQTRVIPATTTQIPLTICVQGVVLETGQRTTSCREITLHQRSFPADAYKFTFLDRDGSVHFAVTRPPMTRLPCEQFLNGACPVIFSYVIVWKGCRSGLQRNVLIIRLHSLHGAGVDADYRNNPAWINAYQQQPYAWILLPTGRREYGYDWQSVSEGNAWAALEYLQDKQPGVPKALRSAYAVDSTRLLYTGHSMGGHGSLLMATRMPDLAVAAAPVSGWIKSELYTPYTSRVSTSNLDPMSRAILESTLAPDDPELHISNLLGIDLLVRIGEDDESVPPYHMRRIARLQFEQGGRVEMDEVDDRAHWWDEVVGGEHIQQFFDLYLLPDSPQHPLLPDVFTISCVAPTDCGSRGGFRIEQTHDPTRIGRIHVTKRALGWDLRTVNVRRWSFQSLPGDLRLMGDVVVDGFTLNGSQLTQEAINQQNHLCRSTPGDSWRWCSSADWLSSFERRRTTYGPFRRVFENSRIFIVLGARCSDEDPEYTAAIRDQAMKISRLWYSQGRGLTPIVPDSSTTAAMVANHNLLILGSPRCNSLTQALSSENLFIVPGTL